MTRVLVLGGTGWLGGMIAACSRDRGADVTCLARGHSGSVPAGTRLVPADRSRQDVYTVVRDTDWDAVVDVSWQPGQVRAAVAALADRSGHWTYVSSCSAYAREDLEGQDELAPLHEPSTGDVASVEQYGPAKVACERIVGEALGGRALIARAGLIAGPGDPSDRFGYWVSRFALASAAQVLVPDAPDVSTQTVDVRDLAAWIANAPGNSVTGTVNAVGERTPLSDVLAASAAEAAFAGTMVPASPVWLTAHGVQPWAGARSLPLWLPQPGYAGFGTHADARALATGLVRRPLAGTIADTLVDERRRGLDRERRAGLTRSEELSLIDDVLGSGVTP